MFELKSKPKIAIFTATGCSVCETMLLDIHYQVHDLTHLFEVSFWPWLMVSPAAEIPEVDVAFFAGAIASRHDREMALQLRQKAAVVVALGACAAFGGLPGLANLQTVETAAPVEAPENIPLAPTLMPQIMGLPQIVDVDYTVPGCPPTQKLLWSALQALAGRAVANTNLAYTASRLPEAMGQAIAAGIRPPSGSIFAGEKAVCASCARLKEEKKFTRARRPYERYETSGRCLLEQGLICLGIATQEGCGGLCTGAGVPCRGCFGKPPAVYDAGAKTVSAISSTFAADTADAAAEIADGVIDLAGTCYRYTLPTQCQLCGGL